MAIFFFLNTLYTCKQEKRQTMGTGLGAIQNFFTKPVQERQAGGANLYTTEPAQFGTFRGAEAGVAGINGEVTPKNFDTEPIGTAYSNGRGHFKYGMGFAPYLA